MEQFYKKLYEDSQELNIKLNRRISYLETKLGSPELFIEDFQYGIGWSDAMAFFSKKVKIDSETAKRIQAEKRRKAKELKEANELKKLRESEELEEKRLEDLRLQEDSDKQEELRLKERLEAIERESFYKKEKETDAQWLERLFNLCVETSPISKWKSAKREFTLKHHSDRGNEESDSNLLAMVNASFGIVFKKGSLK